MSAGATSVSLGTFGVCTRLGALDAEQAQQIERLGYGAIWLGGSPPADLKGIEELLAATSTIAIATGIVNVWTADAAEVAESYHRLEAAYPGRFLLGVGVGHPEAISTYTKPYQALVDYLDVLDEKGVPKERMALAALGPRVLKLAAERTAGAYPYLVTPEYTRSARQTLGDAPLLVVEHKVVVGEDRAITRPLGRAAVANPYLNLANYRANLTRLGYTDADLDNEGSDALIDALVEQGDTAALVARLREHLAAGADHVAVQALSADGNPVPTLAQLAPSL
ncbi:MAG TPA: LLM class F420-dependent oxidoreductase [Pseudonocardia sp.]|jgi:probable F420-dependent oxidoreductase